LRAISALNGAAFTSTLNLYEISIPSPGSYKMTLRSFIHCANVGCEAANDFILIRINEMGTFRDVYRIDNSKGRIRDEKWVNDEFNFTVTNTVDFNVNILIFFLIISFNVEYLILNLRFEFSLSDKILIFRITKYLWQLTKFKFFEAVKQIIN
jgi:hypothetical protein